MEILDLLVRAVTEAPNRLSAVRVDGTGALLDSARQNRKRPAYMAVAVPDGWVRNARGRHREKLGDCFLLVRVPKEVLELPPNVGL